MFERGNSAFVSAVGTVVDSWWCHVPPDASRSVYQLVLPKSERQDVVRDLHNRVMGGHQGKTEVLEELKDFIGQDMSELVSKLQCLCPVKTSHSQKQSQAPDGTSRLPHANGCYRHLRAISLSQNLATCTS